MRERFTRFVDFQKFNAKEKKWVSINCPPDLAAAYLERTGDWKLRVLSGIANAPTLRPDGSILDQPGYDAATGILYDPRGVTYPPIPATPTKPDAALAALFEMGSEGVQEAGAELVTRPGPRGRGQMRSSAARRPKRTSDSTGTSPNSGSRRPSMNASTASRTALSATGSRFAILPPERVP